jgi:hypothetical protein
MARKRASRSGDQITNVSGFAPARAHAHAEVASTRAFAVLPYYPRPPWAIVISHAVFAVWANRHRRRSARSASRSPLDHVRPPRGQRARCRHWRASADRLRGRRGHWRRQSEAAKRPQRADDVWAGRQYRWPRSSVVTGLLGGRDAHVRGSHVSLARCGLEQVSSSPARGGEAVRADRYTGMMSGCLTIRCRSNTQTRYAGQEAALALDTAGRRRRQDRCADELT